MFNAHPSLMKSIAVLAPKHHIFLLSHMRAYTSLFGLIMGSNPAICGYYEMHIGYYSWKSLVRQKLLYFKQEIPKPGFGFMFDKILHNDHHISLQILNSGKASAIFCLRRPEEAIPSILSLYQRIEPAHEFCSASIATQYYIARLDMLENIARKLERDFFYMDAEALKHEPDHCLANLSKWLNLQTPLSTTYEVQRMTSRERYGDTSERIKSGQITRDRSDFSRLQIEENLMKSASLAHDRVREVLIRTSTRQSLSDLATGISIL